MSAKKKIGFQSAKSAKSVKIPKLPESTNLLEVFLHPNILQTDSSKYLLKRKFWLRFHLQVSNNFGSTGTGSGSATLL